MSASYSRRNWEGCRKNRLNLRAKVWVTLPFVSLHLVFVGSRIRRKSFVEICVVVVVVVDFLCSDF